VIEMKRLVALMIMLFFALSVSPAVMLGSNTKESKGNEYTLLAKKDKKDKDEDKDKKKKKDKKKDKDKKKKKKKK
jgi:hypothetical protein